MKKLFSFIFLSATLLTSCSLLSPVKTNDESKYLLTAVPGVKKQTMRHTTLLVLKPETSAAFNTNQIAYKTRPYQLAYFAKNRWAETPSNMVQRLMVQTLQNTRHYHAVITTPFTGTYDYMLSTQLIELVQDFTQNPSIAKLTLRAQIIRTSDSHVIAAKQFSASSVAPENTPYGGVIAANQAISQILSELSIFCVKSS